MGRPYDNPMARRITLFCVLCETCVYGAAVTAAVDSTVAALVASGVAGR